MTTSTGRAQHFIRCGWASSHRDFEQAEFSHVSTFLRTEIESHPPIPPSPDPRQIRFPPPVPAVHSADRSLDPHVLGRIHDHPEVAVEVSRAKRATNSYPHLGQS